MAAKGPEAAAFYGAPGPVVARGATTGLLVGSMRSRARPRAGRRRRLTSGRSGDRGRRTRRALRVPIILYGGGSGLGGRVGTAVLPTALLQPTPRAGLVVRDAGDEVGPGGGDEGEAGAQGVVLGVADVDRGGVVATSSPRSAHPPSTPPPPCPDTQAEESASRPRSCRPLPTARTALDKHRTVTVRVGLVTCGRYDRYRPSVLNPGNALSWKSNNARFSHALPDVGSVGSQPSPARYVHTPSQ